MQRQRDMQVTGVRERCVVEAGATALLRNSRVGCAALVAPASALVSIQKISSADIFRICAGLQTRSVP